MPFIAVEKLDVYRLAEKLADGVWEMARRWPTFDRDTLGRQIVRSADSVGANIAEGAGRASRIDNRRCLRIARGSLLETKFWLRRAYKRKLINEQDVANFKPLLDELLPKLNGYMRSLGVLQNTKHKTQNTI